MLPDLSWSRAYQILRDHPERAADTAVWAQFLKDWARAPREAPDGR